MMYIRLVYINFIHKEGVILQVDTSAAIQIIVLIILLMLSAFFSSAETSLTTVNKIKMRSLADEGNKKAKMVLRITEDISKMLSAILIGNNIVNLSASSITTTIAYSFGASGAVAIATGIITVLILIFGEITPKTVANIKSEKLALAYAYPIRFIMIIVTPISIVINALSKIVFFVLQVDPNAKMDTVTESELRTLVDMGHEDGAIEEEEREMINNVFDLGDAKAKDVMVPGVHVIFADVQSSYEELIENFRENKFTRLPVFEEDTDNIIGTINMKDLLLYDKTKAFNIRDFLREAYFTHEHKNISELLVEMRQASLNIAIVLDEYGETAGIITLEDILEEIVGEIHDEYDTNEEEEIFHKVNEYEFVIEGSTNLADLNDRVELNLESEDYDSLGGYIIEKLDRLPDEKDELTLENGVRIVVDTLDKNRIEKVHIYLPDDFYDEENEEDD